jgi:hypothetical protein
VARTLQISGDDPEIVQQIKTDLNAIEAALSEMLSNGQEYSINGSHSFKGVPYAELRKTRNELRQQLFAMNGGSARVAPDFGAGTGSAVLQGDGLGP